MLLDHLLPPDPRDLYATWCEAVIYEIFVDPWQTAAATFSGLSFPVTTWPRPEDNIVLSDLTI